MRRLGLLVSLIFAVSVACSGSETALERANAAFQNKDYREAVRLYTEALEADSKESTYYLRASAHEKARNYERAIDDYRHVIADSAAESNSTYARKARRRLQDVCVSTCGTYCLKVLPRDALTKEKTEECRALSKRAKNADNLGQEDLLSLAKTCPHNEAVAKAYLRQAIRNNAYKDVRSAVERLMTLMEFSGSAGAGAGSGAGSKEAEVVSASDLRQLSDIYDYLSLIESGDVPGLLNKARKVVASNPEDALSGSVMKMAKALSQGWALFQNATVTQAPSHEALTSFSSLAAKGLDGTDRFVARAENVTAALMKSLYPEFRRYDNAKAVVNFGAAQDRVRGALNIMLCIIGFYEKTDQADSCAEAFEAVYESEGGGGGATTTFSGYKTTALNAYYVALYHALQASTCVKQLQASKRRGDEFEDELPTCEKAVNRARAAFRESQQLVGDKKADATPAPLEKDINRISDRVFEMQKELLVPNFYKILGVTKTTPLNDIRKKYYRLAKEYHPDYTPANATDEEKRKRERKFQRIAEAWDVLSDPEKKKQYDSGMYMQEELAQREAAHQHEKMTAQQAQQAQQAQYQQFQPFQQFQQFNFGGNGGGYRRIIIQQGGQGANGGNNGGPNGANFDFFNNDFFRQFGFA